MDNHPHYVWAFVALVAIGLVAWAYASNRPDVNNYAKGSNPIGTDIRHYSAVDINPCGVLFKIDPNKDKNVKSSSVSSGVKP